MHPDQLLVPDATAAALVAEQFSQWRELPLRRVPGAGTVHEVFRLGEDLAVRLPLRDGDPQEVRTWLLREAAAAREFAAHCPFPTPVPVAIGDPGHGYPLPWSVQTWIPGEVATVADPGCSEAFADDLVVLLGRLRAVGTRGRRFTGTGRGGHLPDHDGWVEECLRRSAGLLDVGQLRRLWAQLRDLPRPAEEVMCHGDVVPGNILVRGGRLAGVLDAGGFGPADPALDLVGAWHLLEAGPRQRLRQGLGSDAVQWQRGMAWALEQSLGLVWYYRESNPAMALLGRRTIERLLTRTTSGSST